MHFTANSNYVYSFDDELFFGTAHVLVRHNQYLDVTFRKQYKVLNIKACGSCDLSLGLETSRELVFRVLILSWVLKAHVFVL